jgi:hypothetical protein
VGGGAALFVVLLGLAAFQAVLVGSQQRLDDLDRRVAAEHARYQQLRLETARLESPARIVAEATARLGMVPPEQTSYLSPSAATLAGTPLAPDPAGLAGGSHAAEAATADEAGTSDWAEVKPFLGDNP